MGKIRIFLVITLLAFANVVFSQDGKVLNVPYVHQEGNTCWAATSVEMLAYYGINVNLCEFVEYTRNTTSYKIQYSDGHVRFRNCKNCCSNGTVHDSCRYAGYNDEIINGLKHYGLKFQNSYVDYSNKTKSFVSCKSRIDAGIPFIIRWGYERYVDNNKSKTSSGGHVVVVRGYAIDNKNPDDGEIYYIDSQDGYHIKSHSWMLYHTTSDYKVGPTWDWTLFPSNSPTCASYDLIFQKPITSNKQIKSTNSIDVNSVISAKSVTFEFGNEFTANSGFEVKLGSTVEIKPNATLKCK